MTEIPARLSIVTLGAREMDVLRSFYRTPCPSHAGAGHGRLGASRAPPVPRIFLGCLARAPCAQNFLGRVSNTNTHAARTHAHPCTRPVCLLNTVRPRPS